MDVFYIFLIIFSFSLAKTRTLKDVCKESTCAMEPDGACTVTCQNGILATRLPDGPLRHLTGTVRNLTLMVDNSVKGKDPTVVIGWISPKDVRVREYEVYLMTWDNAVLPLESAALPYRYLVHTSLSTGRQQMTVRVTSSSFRGMNDITVYVNTWVGDRQPCNLRQAKTTFYTMASMEPTSSRWHYYPTMAPLSQDVINVTFTSFPGADLHDLELCKINDVTAREICQAVTLYESVRTANFNVNDITCGAYRLSIIPDPNPNNEVIEVKVLIPDLNCSVCEHDTWSPSHQLSLNDQPTDLSESSVKETLPVETIIWSVVASLVGLTIGIIIVVVKIRRRNQLRSSAECGLGMKMDLSFRPNNDHDFGDLKLNFIFKQTGKTEDLQSEIVKSLCIVYSDDSPCHQNVVVEFAHCLTSNFRFDVKLVTCLDNLSHDTSGSDVTLVVSSDRLFWLVQEPNQFAEMSRVSGRTRHVVDDFRDVAMTRKMIIVRFDYTKRHLPMFCDNVSTFNLPEELRSLVCSIENCKLDSVPWADRNLQDLMTLIQVAITCHDKVGLGAEGCACQLIKDSDGGSCVSWISRVRQDENKESSHVDDLRRDFLPPTPVSEYDGMSSINQQLFEIDRDTQIDSQH